jgi:2-methylisocitrate lyase-like PEP mutase family enzyme
MTSSLKQRLTHAPAVLAPGAYDALSALLIQQAGFEAIYISGASIAYTQLGRPDFGLVAMDHLAEVVGRIAERVDLPLIVDADTGFGNALNTARTVKRLERNGAAAIQLEDQQFPKRCGHLDGKTLVEPQEMVSKVAAAVDARVSAETLIIARTDAVGVEGFDRALERAALYVRAGADVLFVEAVRSVQQMRELVHAFGAQVPLLANMVEGGLTPLLSVQDLTEIGFRLVISPGALVRAVIPAAEAFLASLKSAGSSQPAARQMTDLKGVNQRIGLAAMLELAAGYEDRARQITTGHTAD